MMTKEVVPLNAPLRRLLRAQARSSEARSDLLRLLDAVVARLGGNSGPRPPGERKAA